MHNGCTPPMVHRDVKTTNILLNEHFDAKLADFGLSRLFPTKGETHVSTDVVGTPGYLDPKYNNFRTSHFLKWERKLYKSSNSFSTYYRTN